MKNLKYILFAFILIVTYSHSSGQKKELCIGSYWTEDEGNLKMKEFARTWNDISSWEKRANRIKEGIIKGLKLDQMPEIEGNFNAIVRNTKRMDGYIVENIAIESFPGFYITGNLYTPIAKSDKHAAILTPHGHAKDGRFTERHQILCAAFARMGAIVFAYDMIGFGESVQVNHNIPIAAVIQTFNSKRVLDYLLSRPDVDPERIGVTGCSGGGTQTFLITAVDDRIKVSAPVTQVSAHFFGGCVCESGMPIHRYNGFQTNNVEIAALCAPRPLLLVSNGEDWTRNTPIIEYPYVKKVYALYDAEHRVENVHLPLEVHSYDYSKRLAAYNFFAHHLKLNNRNIPYNDGYKEDFVEILSFTELRVFDKDHPMPDNALMGDQAVMDYLGIHNYLSAEELEKLD